MSNRSKEDCGADDSRANRDEGVPDAFEVEGGDLAFHFTCGYSHFDRVLKHLPQVGSSSSHLLASGSAPGNGP
ncbi:MAG: hypothetical protein CL912_04670 [Deltaproteobacteria bacterium]|nr:hypothetical protein [Deltaproteobacteria bacterium]